MKKLMIYGSYGFSGGLITERALQQGLKPVLAGRDAERLKTQAEGAGLEYRPISLQDRAALDDALREVGAVLHCAGPFVHTFGPMAEACIRNGCHYVDITGEIPVFEALAGMDEEARKAGVMLLPGAGFDVVPSDCLAAHLKKRLPTATHLRLFLRGVGGGLSRGTAASAIEHMNRGALVRRDGKIVSARLASRTVKVDFGRGPVWTALFNWGDVSTAWHSTGIPNIEVYIALPRRIIDGMHAVNLMMPLLSLRPVKNLLKRMLKRMPPGPDSEYRQKSLSVIQGEVTDGVGQRAVSRLTMPEGYTLTAMTSVEIMRRVMAGNFRAGFQTPSRAYGSGFISEFENVQLVDLQ